MNWPEDRSRLIVDAYEIRGKKGVSLLSGMGSFDLWRGSLARMRGDSSAEVATDTADATNAERFLQTLSVSRALDLMPAECVKLLRLAYFDRSDESARCDRNLVPMWTNRLLNAATVIYQELSSEEGYEVDNDFAAAIPLSTGADHEQMPAERK